MHIYKLTSFFLLASLCSCQIDRTVNSISSAEAKVFSEFLELPSKSQLQINDKNEPGEAITICLTLVDKANKEIIPNQKMLFYHTDESGNYTPANATDESTARLRGEATTDEMGRILLRTILPGDYGSSTNNRHIHTTVFGAKPEAYDIHFKQYTDMMGKRFVGGSDQHFLADLKRNSDGSLIAFLTIEVKEPVPQASIRPALAALTVKDLNLSAQWYKEILGFEEDTIMRFPEYNNLVITFLKLGDFRLELISSDKSVNADRSKLPNEYANIHGLIKLGFVTDNLEKVIQSATDHGAEVIVSLGDIPPLKTERSWPNKFALLKDPDGNYIQFFNGSANFMNEYDLVGSNKLAPFLAMYSVADFRGTVNWLQNNLGFKYIEEAGEIGNQRGILSQGRFIIELGNFKDDRSLEELGLDGKKTDIVRLNKLGFSSTNFEKFYEESKAKGLKVKYENLDPANGDVYFILEDSEENLIQFFKD